MGNNVDKNSTNISNSPKKIIKAQLPPIKGVEHRKSQCYNHNQFHPRPSVINIPNRKGEKKKRIIITAKDVKMSNTEYDVLEIVKKNNHEDLDHSLIEKCILNHFFMRNLEKEARNEIIREMTLCRVKAKDIVFKQGSIGNFFYIIKEGDLDLIIDNKKVKTLSKGNSFGELALINGASRSGTVKSINGSLLWCMERKNFKKIIDHINSQNYMENIKFINDINFFSGLSNNLKTLLSKNIIKVYFEPKDIIVKEGDLASCLYIIKEGEVECVMNGKLIRTLKSKDYFGEKSILLESKRTMDVIAKTKTICYGITVDYLKHMVGDKINDVLLFNFLEIAFEKSNFFNKVNPKLFQKLIYNFSLKDYIKGEIVVPSGHNIGSTFIIVIEGSVSQKGKEKEEYKRGQIIFEKELISFDINSKKKTRLQYDLVADPDCLIMSCNTNQLINLIGCPFKEMFAQSNVLDSLSHIPLFKTIPQEKLNYLSKVIKIEKYSDKAFIIKQDDVGDLFYIVKSGKVDIYKDNKYIRTINENGSFGFKALFNKEIRTASAISNGKVECYALSGEDFKKVLEETLRQYLEKKMMLEDDEISLQDLEFIKELGVGSFGNVSLVKSSKNHYLYAIKAMNRVQIDLEKLHKNIELERSIMLKVDHPFITKLVKTMKNDGYIFFLMEYNYGKELWDVIRDIGLLNKEQTQFYAASTMLAVDYLHQRHYVHRDIKPENIMVLENGYIKVIDFGTCKEIIDKTNTIIGTPHYMAPEAILGEGYTFQVDFWSIGIMMFEFMCGCVPFGDNVEDPMDVYKMIIHSNLKFPTFIKDRDFLDICKKMLAKLPIARLGTLFQIKSHNFFKGFNFENLSNLTMEPCYKPDVPSLNPDMLFEEESYMEHTKKFKKVNLNKLKGLDPKIKKECDKWYENF